MGVGLQHPTQRTNHRITTALNHMRIDLRGPHILVAELFLYGADVRATF